jgi:hypothetical protein
LLMRRYGRFEGLKAEEMVRPSKTKCLSKTCYDFLIMSSLQ